MKIQSKILGEIDIPESEIIRFPAGIPAFEDEKEFVVLPLAEYGPFYYLQSARNTDLCLLMADPFNFFPDYNIEIKEEQLDKLEAQEGDKNIAVFAVLAIPEDFCKTTANLLAPILINMATQKGLQFISPKSDYKTKHPIFKQITPNLAAVAQEGR
jgi:flagellar assembly factor FliW